MAGSIAAGAQAGAAFGPWGAAIGGALGAASDVASAAMGGPFMGGDSAATYGNVNTDHSGWTVNIGSGTARTDNQQSKTDTRSDAATDKFAAGLGYSVPAYGAAPGSINPTLVLAAIGAVVAIAFIRR